MENNYMRYVDALPRHVFVVCAETGSIVETSSTISGACRGFSLGGNIYDVLGCQPDLRSPVLTSIATLGGRVGAEITTRRINDNLSFVEVEIKA